MKNSSPFVEVHYAIWGVLAVPIGFAGTFFLIPGLLLEWGIPLLAISGLLIGYVSNLTQMKRAAWLFGLAFHALLLLAGAYYLPRWPALLSVPLALANVYSLIVLMVYRDLWTTSSLGVLESDSAIR